MNSDAYEIFRSKLKLRHLQSQNLLAAKYPKIAGFLTSASKIIASGAAVSSLSLSAGNLNTLTVSSPSALVTPYDLEKTFKEKISQFLPEDGANLSLDQEEKISDIIYQRFGIKAYASLDGNRLNSSYGLIGAEQHLSRFPGDTASQHDSLPNIGIAAGRGAWGYFAPSQDQMTPDLYEKERYYVAVQTLYLPDYTERLAYYRDWFKYRKVIVINPKSGRAVIAVIADSGPAWWTGKKFGGSPEVMDYLKSKDGRQKSAVILFFVDDPNDEVPLGPLEPNLPNQKVKLLS